MADLGPFFKLAEFHSRDGARVPDHAVDELEALCRDFLTPLRKRFGQVVVHSAFRSPAHNRRVGGAPQSYHRYDLPGRQGVAVDFTCKTGTPREWYRFLEQRGAGGLGLYPTFVHVDNRAGRARW